MAVSRPELDRLAELLTLVQDQDADTQVTVRLGDLRKLWSDNYLLEKAVDGGMWPGRPR
jgi:hypothetical protein